MVGRAPPVLRQRALHNSLPPLPVEDRVRTVWLVAAVSLVALGCGDGHSSAVRSASAGDGGQPSLSGKPSTHSDGGESAHEADAGRRTGSGESVAADSGL